MRGLKSSEPIRVKINTSRGRDWPKARALLFGALSPRGSADPHTSSHWPRPRAQDPPMALLAASLVESPRPPPPKLFVVFPSEGRGNIPLASSVGSRGQPRRRRSASMRRRASSGLTFRSDPLHGPNTRKKTRLLDMIFNSASTSLSQELPVV